ncbi:protein pigeon-like [Sycon ciliatum]|uniref:protein pigeon-like n=1 Tax=Sycon ciliatum TaxID=27933 RepID=UPI0020ACA0D1|eukprot:scpid7260/ scgid33102/ Protein pigeon; Protein linotte
MFEFSPIFSLGESLLPFVAHLITETKEDGSFASMDERGQAAVKLLKAKVIGRERDGSVLVSWVGVTNKDGSDGKAVTLIGLLEGRNPLTLLYAHDELTHVVSASIDQGRSLLSFTEVTRQTTDNEGEHGNEAGDEASRSIAGASPIRTYRSYVVELKPAGRLLALNVERSLYQRTQFIYANTGRSAAPSKDVYMLYILHRESVGIYHFKLQQLDNVLVICGQPVTCELWSRPVWFQWSHANQRLYFVYNKPQVDAGNSDLEYSDLDSLNGSGCSLDDDASFYPVLRVAEFFDGGAHEVVMEVRLQFSMVISDAPVYDLDATWCECVPDINCNMAVLQLGGEQRVGSLCVAYQHAGGRSQDSQFPASLKYSVCILHHAYHMELSMPLMPALQENQRPQQLLFAALGDYVMVYMPGRMLHLLDCSTEHGAFHHLLLQEDVPVLPFNGTRVSPWPVLALQPSTGGIFNVQRQEAYTVSIHRQELAILFAETQQESLRAAVLHLALIHQRDSGLARKMIEHLCRDPAAPDCTTLLAEYLLAASYTHMRREQLDQTVMQLLPISLADPFRNHVEEGRDGCQHVRISYSRMHGLKEQIIGWQPDPTQEPLAQVVVPSQNKLLLGLQRNLRLRDGPARFNLRAIQHKLESAPSPSPTSDSPSTSISGTQPTESLGFFRRLSSSLNARRSASAQRPTTLAPASSLPFLETQPEEEILADHRRTLVVDHFRFHLKRHSHESAEKCQQIAHEYASTQMHHSKYLLNAIWTSLRHPTLGQPSQVLLSDRGGPRDKALFTMAEHFSAAVRSCGFPTPSGFNQFFAALGLRCLEHLTFLQYAQQNVFSLPLEFVRRVVRELNNTPENAELKFQILNRLKYEDVVTLLVEWGHPAASRYMSQKYVTAAMQTDAKESWELSSFSQKGHAKSIPNSSSKASFTDDGTNEVDGSESLSSTEDGIGINFPPVANLMQVLRTMELDLKRSQLPQHLQQWSMNRVEDACLQESQTASSSSRPGCVFPL